MLEAIQNNAWIAHHLKDYKVSFTHLDNLCRVTFTHIKTNKDVDMLIQNKLKFKIEAIHAFLGGVVND